MSGPRVTASLVVAGLLVGATAHFTGHQDIAGLIWAATASFALISLSASVIRELIRKSIGVDLIALVAIAAALALGEYLAGAVVALMMSGGELLESYAASRARRELTLLADRAPKFAHRYQADNLQTIDVRSLEVGDRILVKPGEIVPVDGAVIGFAVLDESALTGESRPVESSSGDVARSGTVNAGGPFDMRATATAEKSAYAGILRLVEQAEKSKAPFIRLADRYSAVFLPLTLIAAGVAWGLSGDPVRALAVLVVATPCPLILAAPAAIISGISRAARVGVVVKGGGALETLARSSTLVIDKTGTLTSSMPRVIDLQVFEGDAGQLLGAAGSLDQVSPHVFAAAVVEAARAGGEELSFPTRVREEPGIGIHGHVGGRAVRLGKAEWVFPENLPRAVIEVRRRAEREGNSNVFVWADGIGSGALIMRDPIRPDARSTIARLRANGFKRVVMLTGDQRPVADSVAKATGVDAVLSERSAEQKVVDVLVEARRAVTAMVGDGINDAPALAAADVGVAMGARGSAAHSEAADIVITVDRLDRLVDAVEIARRSRGIAVQSVLFGMGLSLMAMAFAGFGFIAPVAGSFLQEGIDVAVILNALRALGPGRTGGSPTEHPGPKSPSALARESELKHARATTYERSEQ